MSTRMMSETDFWQEVLRSLDDANISIEPYSNIGADRTASYRASKDGNIGYFIAVADVSHVTKSGIEYRMFTTVTDTKYTSIVGGREVLALEREICDTFADSEFDYVKIPDDLTIYDADDDEPKLLNLDGGEIMTDDAWDVVYSFLDELTVFDDFEMFSDEEWVRAVLYDDKSNYEVMFDGEQGWFTDAVELLLEVGSLEDKKVCLVNVIRYAREDTLVDAHRAHKAIKDGHDIEEYDGELAESGGYEIVNTCKDLGFDFRELCMEAGR